MDTLRGGAALSSLPGHVRDDLTDVDRLRAIWAQHRHGQPRDARGAARRELARRRVQAWGGGSALEEFVVSISEEGMSGQPVSASYIEELSRRAAKLPSDRASRSPGRPLGAKDAERLAEAAAIPAHPVVRAAHTFAECVAVLRELAPEAADHGPPWALPWVLASLVLQFADFPPLLPDPLASPPPEDGRSPDERFAALVHHFSRLVTSALRDELSWAPGSVPPPRAPVPPLATVTCRRVQDYMRSRRESLSLILQALDPEARTSVSSGGYDEDPAQAPGVVPAARTVLTLGAAHWWTALELVVDEASLTLFVVVQEVGRPRTGVLAVTADGRLTTPEGVRDALDMSGTDSVTVMPTDCVDDRWPQIRDLVDEAISRAMNALTQV